MTHLLLLGTGLLLALIALLIIEGRSKEYVYYDPLQDDIIITTTFVSEKNLSYAVYLGEL